MRATVEVNSEMLIWAIARAGYNLPAFSAQFPHIESWLEGEKKPTVKQLEAFSKKVCLPFGYMFLSEPPKEELPIPFFRSNADQADRVSVNVYDTILIMQQRQDWLRDYLGENDSDPLPFVGSFSNKSDVRAIVEDIRRVLDLQENWASHFKTWTDAFNNLVENIEDKGIITVFNSVVGNNPHRKIPVDDCRGFVLVDPLAPFLFINNDDFKSAQMFTIVHELAHIWTGHSAGFDFRKMQPADDPIEKLCDKVAAEFLVPEISFHEIWNKHQDTKWVARHFKVSEIVIARRALDTGKWTWNDFKKFYEEYKQIEFTKKNHQSPGGDFFATTRKRLSVTFATHIHQALKNGHLLYRDACKLTGLKGDTFERFITTYLY